MRYFVKKSENVFQEFFKNLPEIDWCKITKPRSSYSSNIFAKGLILFCKNIAPELIQGCPFQSFTFEKKNVTVPNVIISLVPAGIYRIMLTIRKDDKIVLFNSSLTVNIF